MKVKKASGELVEFDESKLLYSLKKSGANAEQAQQVLNDVLVDLVEGMSTRKIYKKAYKKLRQYSPKFAARYHLKEGIFQLGPDGYLFEQFVALILKAKGYKVQTNRIFQGRCVTHEVDVFAVNSNERILIECKFKNTQGLKSDVKVPLYIHSRDNDINSGELKHSKAKGWIVNNTEFSEDAIAYAKCIGLHLVSWKYPHQNNLRQLIESTGTYPVTCLSSLTRKEKEQLLVKKIILLKDLVQRTEELKNVVSSRRVKKVIEEANTLLEETKSYVRR